MSLRAPNNQFVKRNGFDEYTEQFPTESLKEAEAAEAQDVARFVIREMGSFFPSLDEMKKEINSPETVASLTERIKRLKRENQDDMTKLSRYYAQELHDDALDRYRQTDDIKYFDFEDFSKSSDVWAEHYARLENFFKLNDKIVASEHNDLVARMQYEHIRELIPLYRQRRELEKHQRIRRDVFPQSTEEYRNLSWKRGGRDMQLLVARFLMAEEATQADLCKRYEWTREKTEPLMKEYKESVSLRKEMKELIQKYSSSDPWMR